MGMGVREAEKLRGRGLRVVLGWRIRGPTRPYFAEAKKGRLSAFPGGMGDSKVPPLRWGNGFC
jgi:hypothetical protein